MGARYLVAAAALTACAGRGPDLPEAVSVEVGHAASEPRVIWVAPGPDAWTGPVVSDVVPGLQRAFRSRLGRVVGVVRLVRWVESGALNASGIEGPQFRIDAPWVLAIQVDGWGLRTGESAVESFIELELSLRDESGAEVWHSRVACEEPLLVASAPGSGEIARRIVALDNEQLQAIYSGLAQGCGYRAWRALSEAGGRRRAPGKTGSPGR